FSEGAATAPSYSPMQMFLTAFIIPVIEDLDSGLIRFEAWPKNLHESVRFAYYLDPSRDYAIVRTESWIRFPMTATELQQSGWVDVEWEQINDVWVPVSLSGRDLDFSPEFVEIRIDWHSVNEPIDPSVFTREAVQATPDKGVIDETIEPGKRLIVKLPTGEAR